jgi:hypothetical protein
VIALEIRCLTRQQLGDYSTFTLPPAARPLVGRKSLRVPPLTLERIRTLERHGAFDTQHTPAYVVSYRARRHGDTALYSGRDLVIARFAAWMLHVGFPMHQLPQLLRGDYPLLSRIRTLSSDFALVCQFSDRHSRRIVVGTAQEIANLRGRLTEGSASWVFPIAWLRRSGFLPKVRKATMTPIMRWRQEWTPRELVARQQREIEPARR